MMFMMLMPPQPERQNDIAAQAHEGAYGHHIPACDASMRILPRRQAEAHRPIFAGSPSLSSAGRRLAHAGAFTCTPAWLQLECASQALHMMLLQHRPPES